MNKEMIPIVVRAALQALAGALTVRGVTVDDGTIEAVSGGIIAVITVIWSYKAKEKIKANTVTLTKP